jgi:hypothetical protein
MKKETKNKKSDINKTKEFYEWKDKTFTYVDHEVKTLMYRAWCAGIKEARKIK